MLDYTFKRAYSDFRYVVIANRRSPHWGWAERAVIRPAVAALRERYGVRFEDWPFGTFPASEISELTYAIYGPTNPLTLSAEEREYLRALAAFGAKVNILAAYPLTRCGLDTPEYGQAGMVVPALCAELGVNVIFADDLNLERGIRTITWQDLRDNVIGETVRVKYDPWRSTDRRDLATLARLHDQHAETVALLTKLHAECGLWQRAVTDGSVLLGDGSGGGWYCSATKTDKTAMGSSDFSAVLSFDETDGMLRYAGRKLPSSDGPEHLSLSRLMAAAGSAPQMIVHFHHLELTRGDRYPQLTTAMLVEYGQFVSGHLLFDELRRMESPWLVQLEHGMVWTGQNVAAFVEFLEEVGLK